VRLAVERHGHAQTGEVLHRARAALAGAEEHRAVRDQERRGELD
jgi:hypothetical protein